MDFLEVFNVGTHLQFIRIASFEGYIVKGEGRTLDNLKKIYLFSKMAEFETGLLEEIKSLINRLQRTYKKDEKLNLKDRKEIKAMVKNNKLVLSVNAEEVENDE